MSEKSDRFNINIVYDELETYEGAKGIGSIAGQMVRKVGTLNTEELANNLSLFCQHIGQIFAGVTTTVKDYELHTFELVVEVSAKGEIRFIGSAASELKGGLKLVFTRQQGR